MKAQIDAILAKYDMKLLLMFAVGRQQQMPDGQVLTPTFNLLDNTQPKPALIPVVFNFLIKLMGTIPYPPLAGSNAPPTSDLVFPGGKA